MNLINMAQVYRKTVRINLKRKIVCRVSILKRYLRQFWSTVVQCSSGKRRYRQLNRASMASSTLSQRGVHSSFVSEHPSSISTFLDDQDIHDHDDANSDSDLVDLKISLLGDPDIGKTSFMVKYVGNNEKEEHEGHEMNKTLYVEGARISYSIWEVGGDVNSKDRIPVACKDSVAILIMFDLTSRCTLNSVIRWYQQAREWNQAAIPILIGTKFDDFIQLPIDLQWTIASQARTYAKALNATLFFSSATYNINVNKIFKFLTAKLFDLPWTVERNLTVGEPIIDF